MAGFVSLFVCVCLLARVAVCLVVACPVRCLFGRPFCLLGCWRAWCCLLMRCCCLGGCSCFCSWVCALWFVCAFVSVSVRLLVCSCVCLCVCVPHARSFGRLSGLGALLLVWLIVWFLVRWGGC